MNKIKSIDEDPDLCSGLFSLDDKLHEEQVQFLAKRLRDLLCRLQASSSSHYARPIDWPEWKTFIEAAYCCGFVCRDGSEYMDPRGRVPIRDVLDKLKRDPNGVADMSLRQLRQVMHFVMRDERWGDQGGDTGGGAVWHLITSELGDAFARRLGA